MFEMELKNTSDDKSFANERLEMIKKVLESISDMVDQVGIKLTEKGMAIQAIDAMHVSLADIFFSKEFFSSYRCDRDVKVAFHLKNLLNILRVLTFDEHSSLILSCEDTPSTFKLLHVDSESRSEFDITLFQLDSSNFSASDLTYDCIIRMGSNQFRNATKRIGLFDDFIKIQCEKDYVTFGQTGDLVSGSMKMHTSDSIFIDCTNPVSVEITKKYITQISKISAMGDDITISVSNDLPIFFDVNMRGLGFYKFYVAPKENRSS